MNQDEVNGGKQLAQNDRLRFGTRGRQADDVHGINFGAATVLEQKH